MASTSVFSMREIVILGKGALWEGEGAIWGAPEATNIRLLYAKGIKLIPSSTLAWRSVTDRGRVGSKKLYKI